MTCRGIPGITCYPCQGGTKGKTFLLCVVPRSTDRCKALQTSNGHIVIAAGAVDDQQLSVGVPSADNTHMGIIWIEHQVTGLGVRPRNIGTIAMLHRGPAAVADDIAAARLIEENPIHK